MQSDKAEKKEEMPVNPNKVTASTIEELTAKLKELLAEREAYRPETDEAEKQERPHFDIIL